MDRRPCGLHGPLPGHSPWTPHCRGGAVLAALRVTRVHRIKLTETRRDYAALLPTSLDCRSGTLSVRARYTAKSSARRTLT
jgi:hypothetical protein